MVVLDADDHPARAVGSLRSPMALLPSWAPNLHPLVIHFPIALIIVAAFADLIDTLVGRPKWLASAATMLFACGSVGAIVACLTGQQALDTVLMPGMGHRHSRLFQRVDRDSHRHRFPCTPGPSSSLRSVAGRNRWGGRAAANGRARWPARLRAGRRRDWIEAAMTRPWRRRPSRAPM